MAYAVYVFAGSELYRLYGSVNIYKEYPDIGANTYSYASFAAPVLRFVGVVDNALQTQLADPLQTQPPINVAVGQRFSKYEFAVGAPDYDAVVGGPQIYWNTTRARFGVLAGNAVLTTTCDFTLTLGEL